MVVRRRFWIGHCGVRFGAGRASASGLWRMAVGAAVPGPPGGLPHPCLRLAVRMFRAQGRGCHKWRRFLKSDGRIGRGTGMTGGFGDTPRKILCRWRGNTPCAGHLPNQRQYGYNGRKTNRRRVSYGHNPTGFIGAVRCPVDGATGAQQGAQHPAVGGGGGHSRGGGLCYRRIARCGDHPVHGADGGAGVYAIPPSGGRRGGSRYCRILPTLPATATSPAPVSAPTAAGS